MKIIRQHFEEIDSTNTYAKRQAHLFDSNALTLITADAQTAGRGRFNRKWVSPSKLNIYSTFCFFLDKNRKDIGNIPQIMALSAAEVLEKYNFKPTLKWPNDILLSGKKIGGILAETTPLEDSLCVIIGIGININMSIEWLNQIDIPATSLLAESGKPFEVEDVFSSLKDNFAEKILLFIDKGFPPFLKNYKNRIETSLNQKISFHDNQKIWEGVFHSIKDDGSLNLLLEYGDIKNFVVGEILWPKP